MKVDTIKGFFKEAFNVDVNEMLINKELDVSKLNKKVLSFNVESNLNEYKLVKKIIRKSDDYMYLTYVQNEVLENPKGHKFYVKFNLNKEAMYVKVGDLFKSKLKFYLLSKDNVWELVDKIERTKQKIKIFDFEVEGNHNYFTNNYLSHNTMFGNPETQTGGNALKFYASQRIDVRKSTTNKDKDDESISNLTKVKIIKNKVAPPFRKAEFDIEFGTGIDIIKDIINVAVDLEIIKKAGSWFSYGETRLGQGIEKVKELLKDNPELVEEITEKIYTQLSK